MQKRILRVLSLLLTLVLLTGCTAQRARSKKKVRIGVSVYDSYDTFITELTGAFRENAALQQGSVQIEMSDAARSQELQDKAVRQMLDNGCDIICVNLVDRTAPGKIIDMAKKKDVPIIFFNRELVEEDLERWNKLYYVGADARESGVIQGRLAAAYLKAHPEADRNHDGVIQYVVLEGEAGHQDAILRTEYATSTLRDEGIALEKLGYALANWNRLQAQTQVRQLLTSYGSRIELILANNDDMALGALDAYRESAVTPPPVFGIDGTNPGLTAVREGSLTGTVRNDSEGQAKAMLSLALSLSTGGKCEYPLTEGRYIRLPYEPITAASLSSMTERSGAVSR